MRSEVRNIDIGLLRLMLGEEGQDLVEYALIASLVSVGAVVVMKSYASGLVYLYTQIVTTLSTLT